MFCAAVTQGCVQALEAKLEAKGMNLKELAPLSIDSTTEWTYGRSPTRRNSRDSTASGISTTNQSTSKVAQHVSRGAHKVLETAGTSSRRSSGLLCSPIGSLPSSFLQHQHSFASQYSGGLRSVSYDGPTDRSYFRQHMPPATAAAPGAPATHT